MEIKHEEPGIRITVIAEKVMSLYVQVLFQNRPDHLTHQKPPSNDRYNITKSEHIDVDLITKRAMLNCDRRCAA